jgi:hypothetical protein
MAERLEWTKYKGGEIPVCTECILILQAGAFADLADSPKALVTEVEKYHNEHGEILYTY